jgi:hypothetical protein
MTASAVIDQTAALSLKGSSREKDRQAALDIQAQIKSLELVGFTPYSGQYIGREIDQGQLNLDVHYDIQGQQLVGKNKVRFNRFILGDKVESPDAANLPVDLALALMRDKNGVIDLDFGVSGDMSAPAFSFAGLIWKALGNLIVKAAASPFALLPNLSGTDIDIEHVFYVPGSSVLADGEIEKLDLLVTALQSRPTLAVQVIGSVDAEDRMALQVQQLQKAIYAELSESAPVDEQAWQRNKNFLKRLEARYQDQVGQGSAALHEQWQQAQPMLTADERHAQALDAMLHAVAAKEVVPDSVVLALALARSRVVSAYLIEKQLPPEAVFVMTAELAVGVTTLKLVAR